MLDGKHLMFCAERGRLLDAMLSATHEFTHLAEMQLKQLQDSRHYSAELEVELEAARTDMKNARQALETHKLEHGCALRQQD